MSSTANLKISEGEDRESVEKAIQRLVTESNWELLNGNAIQKTFHCRNWTKVMVRLEQTHYDGNCSFL